MRVKDVVLLEAVLADLREGRVYSSCEKRREVDVRIDGSGSADTRKGIQSDLLF